jgi:hypothetical protein
MSQADDYAKLLGWGAPAGSAPAAAKPSGMSIRAETPDRGGAGRQRQSIDFWVGKGAPRHVAEGITDAFQGESGLNPEAFNPAGGGQGALGTGQWRGARQSKLKELPNYSDFGTQLDFSYSEVTGGDPIASKHWNEIKGAPDRATAKQLWSRYFERPGTPTTQADKAMISDEAIRYSTNQPNSRTVYANALDLIAMLPEPDEKTAGGRAKGKSLRNSVLDRGEQIEDLPHIDVTVDKNGRAKVTDYDGLHRLQLLAEMGVNAVPVRISGVPKDAQIRQIQDMRGNVRPFDFQPVQAPPPPPRNWWEKVWGGVGTGAADPVIGATQLATPARAVDPAAAPFLPPEALADVTSGKAVESFDRAVQQREQTYQGQRQAEGDTGPDWGRLAGNVLATAPLAAVPGVGAGGAAVSAAARAGAGALLRTGAGVAAGAGAGAATGAVEGLLRPVTEPGDFGAQKGGQIGEGALFGAAGGGVLGGAGAGVNVLRSLVTPNAVTRAAARLFGEDAKRLTPELLARVKARVQSALNRVESGYDIKIDNQLVRDLGTTSNRARDLLGATEAKPVEDAIDRILERARGNGIIPARSAATLWHKGSRLDNLTESANPDIARLAQDAQNGVRSALNRQLPPDEAAAYSAARGQWRDLKIAEKTLRPGETELDPRRFVTQVARRFPNQASTPGGPPMLELGRAAGETWPARSRSGADAAGLLGALLGHLVVPAVGGIAGGHVAGTVAGRLALNSLAQLRSASPNALRALRPAPGPAMAPPTGNALLMLSRAAQQAPVAASAPLSYEIAR